MNALTISTILIIQSLNSPPKHHQLPSKTQTIRPPLPPHLSPHLNRSLSPLSLKMAFTAPSLLTLFTIISLTLFLTQPTLAGRGLLFASFDGTVLIPGIGRVVVPPKFKKGFKKGFNPFTYNPVTGTGGGTTQVPSFGGIVGGSGGGSGRSYIPGGDDTFIPNPGVEVPVPGGSVPTPARH